MIGKLNHVGVATPSIDQAVTLYRDLLGATSIGEKFLMEEQGVWVCFVDLPNSQIELIEPAGEKSPLINFLAKNRNYDPFKSRNLGTWDDSQQLMYLCDPSIHILTSDDDFFSRIAGSKQVTRVIKLSDLLASCR